MTPGASAVLAALLIIPAGAAWQARRWIPWYYTFGYGVVISLVTLVLYRHDKRRAESGGWRTPEATLHICELLGGWPGAFLAQRVFRHKTAKRSFQVVYWLIVVLYELVCLDFTAEWRCSRWAFGALSEFFGSVR